MKVDFGLTATDYARHRAGFPLSLFEALAEKGIGIPGQRLVDLGTGTGSMARGFAGRGCQVTGIDPSPQMLATARQIADAAGLAVKFLEGTAEETRLPAHSAEVVTAGQCWHWFDGQAACAEISRILHVDGWLVIAHFDWLPLRGNLVEATEELILSFNPSWTMGGGTGLYPEWLRQLGEAGFRDLKSFSYDEDAPYTPSDWRGRIRASAGVGASLSPGEIDAFDRELEALLASRFPGDVLPIPHRVFAITARPPQFTQ